MDWKKFFADVSVPSPLDKKKTSSLVIDDGMVPAIANQGRNNKLYELFHNVGGMPPPVNNIGHHEKISGVSPDEADMSLINSHALFKGVKRPLTDLKHDENVYIYVVGSKYAYSYIPNMACVAKRVDAPKDAIFVVYATFNDEGCTTGKIIQWEWVKADIASPSLPKNHSNRYDKRVW